MGHSCVNKCAEELAGYMIKDEASNRAKAERISNLEEEVVREFNLKSGSNIDLKNKLEYATKALDRGINDESLLEMCSIVYLPTWATPQKGASWMHGSN